MTHLWTKEETKRLILQFKALPELWDVSANEYRNRIKKCTSLETLAENFKTTPREISRKLHNLRTQLNNELRKIKLMKSGKGDKSYRSSWEFFDSLKFMVSTGRASEMQNNLKRTRKVQTRAPNEVIQAQNSFKTDKRKREVEILESALTTISKPEDDAQIFGNFVAMSIRNLLSDERKRLLKRKIQRVILEVEELDDLDYHASSSSYLIDMASEESSKLRLITKSPETQECDNTFENM